MLLGKRASTIHEVVGLELSGETMTTTKTPISISRMTPTTTISIKIMVTVNLQMLLSARGDALGENGEMGSEMGTDFGDFNNDGFWI